jgi:GTPase SAR1 family protein
MGAIVTFDVTNRSSFQALEDWTRLFLQHVDPDPVIHVIGNKIDLEAARQVSRDEARLWAEGHGFCYFETSASTGTNVVEAFNSLSLAFSKKPGIAVVPNRSMAAEEDDHCC